MDVGVRMSLGSMHALAEKLRDRLPKDSTPWVVLEALGHAWGEGYLRDDEYERALAWLDAATQPSQTQGAT